MVDIPPTISTGMMGAAAAGLLGLAGVAGGASTLVAFRDTLRAFAGGSLLGFGAASLFGKR